MAQTVQMLKQKVVENASHDTWQAKVRKTLTGATIAALGGFLVWRGIDLLMADKSVGQWLALGGAGLLLVGAHIWSGELVSASITSIGKVVAGVIAGIVGAFKPKVGADEPPGPAV